MDDVKAACERLLTETLEDYWTGRGQLDAAAVVHAWLGGQERKGMADQLVKAAIEAERGRCADICKRLGERYMAESELCQKHAPGTRAGEVPVNQAGAAWKCEAAIRGEGDTC